MTSKTKAMAALLASLCLALTPVSVRADERADLEQLRGSLTEMIEALVASGALSRVKADEILAKTRARQSSGAPVTPRGTAAVPAAAGAATIAAQPALPGVRSDAPREPVRVQYVPEAVKRDIKEQVKQDVLAQARVERWGQPGALPEWTDRLRFEGDLRARFQIENFAPGNAPASVLYAPDGLGTNYADLTNSRTAIARLCAHDSLCWAKSTITGLPLYASPPAVSLARYPPRRLQATQMTGSRSRSIAPSCVGHHRAISRSRPVACPIRTSAAT